ncbi:Diphthamide biosynthesis protein 2 [Dissostichus eleginoides]|nr:Diphthamide biosynthesis protein 2 [Dissostichus eleginoides]
MTARGLSTSITAFQHLNRSVPKSEGGKLLFDTHAVVRLFEENGFTTQQAEVIVKILVKMTTSNMDVIYSDMVTKVQQEIMLQRLMSQIASVKKDMLILEKSEFSTLLAENEKLKNELLHIKIQLADVMNKLRSDTIMDMNLEKSRSKELKIENEKLLLETRTEIMEMTAEQDRHLTQTNMKIDTEVAGLKTMLESHKLDTIKYLAGSVFTCLTVVLGFYRIWILHALFRVFYATMADAFSSSSENVIQRVVEVTVGESNPVEKLEELYQIKDICGFITEHQFEKVALQFPDELLVDAVAVALEIERNSNAKPFILGDTSYGSCCVDEVAAEHVGADCIVHYGSACLSPSKRLPLMYVFERRPVDLEKCTSAFRELYPDTHSHIIILYDVNYVHAIDDLMALLSPEYPNLVVSELVVEGEQCYSHGRIKRLHDDTCLSEGDNNQLIYQFGRQFSLTSGLSITDYSMFYVGQEGATLTNFMMTWNRCSFCSFDPIKMTGRTESVSINRALMKRYYAIERAKDANVVGILVGTLGVSDYLKIIQQLKEAIHGAGKKSYLFAMGKLNVPKLANFLEIDIFVLIACPENSLLDSSEFYKPVVTPFEMEVACNRKREWSEEYVTDFRHLLPGGQSHVPLADQQEEGGETDMSLITGALRSQNLMSSEPEVSSFGSSVVLRNQMLTVANTNSAASFLAERSWRGLEQNLGATPVVKAVEGRRGIAIAYEEEG